jgi:uncharacterized membrane protein
MAIHILDFIALAYMLVLWTGYSMYAKSRAQKAQQKSLSHSMRMHRERWVRQMLLRDIRVTDASLLANQERVVGFFASATLIILAAVFTALSSSNLIAEVANQLPMAQVQTTEQVQMKFFAVALVLVYAFFMITWSLRQYGFVAVMMGGAPVPNESITEPEKERFILAMARLMDTAGHDNNKGLRAYYFCLAMLFWIIHPYLYMLMSTVTILVLASREFNSKAVHSLESSL